MKKKTYWDKNHTPMLPFNVRSMTIPCTAYIKWVRDAKGTT
jgi:hypothetical protein